MELPASTRFEAICKASLCSFSSKQVSCGSSHRCGRIGFQWNRNSKSFVGITMSSEKEFLSNGHGGGHNGAAKSGFIDVIGIGSRKDAVLDFCLKSPFQLSSLRFW
ncbi:protein ACCUMULATION AND REPLICATION OF CHLOROPLASTS 3-like isoform X1 [Senna tora]|uniref:Protein ACCUMULATION AND REPLICATION OF CHLOROPLASTS 3-like isoform X1 n=1 Tax=Senna tora TaxID=362788 RepID=A0A834TSE5_9FABA|nr:protein ACCUMULATION AND REPLICATION OF CHLOROPLASTS 3-like isoform X1 [Senna tora]